jgi:hypothetical protein
MRNSKKIIQKGGIIAQVNNTTKNNIKKILASGELVFCNLNQKNPRPNNIANLKSGIPIIIVKKKNGFNQPSNYYAIKTPDNDILTEGLGKKQFYDNLDNLRKQNTNHENNLLATKILIFFKVSWGNNPPFSEDFYDLNTYFISQTS